MYNNYVHLLEPVGVASSHLNMGYYPRQPQQYGELAIKNKYSMIIMIKFCSNAESIVTNSNCI